MLTKTLSRIVVLLLLTAAPAVAQVPAATPDKANAASVITPEQAKRALETLQDDGKRAQMIETLKAIATVAPVQSVAADVKPAVPLGADSLGAQLLATVSEQIGETSRDIADAARSVVRVPALWHWLVRTANEPATDDLLLDLAWKLALVFGCALGAEWLTWRLMQPPLTALAARIPRAARVSAVDRADPRSSTADITEVPEQRRRHLGLTRLWQSLVRLPFVLGRLLLDILPVIVFAGVSLLLLGTDLGDAGVTRLAIIAIINAYVICRSVLCVVRALVGPLSLFTVPAETAAYVDIWARRIVTFVVLRHCGRQYRAAVGPA